jgi:hypothetical protein
MGMILGGFIFKIASRKWPDLSKVADYCFILALIFIPPTVLLGFMDWQHRLFGRVNGLIIAKFALTGGLIPVLSLTVYFNKKGTANQTVILVLYALCVLAAIGLGMIGGELAYG